MTLLLLLLPTDGHLQGIPGYPETINAYDAREVAQLPKYCKYTLEFRSHVPGGNNAEEVARWRSLMGPSFQAMHHYCWALMHTNRALYLAKTKQVRDFHLGASINDIDYVLNNSTPDFVMLPEILTKKGENLISLGRGHLAMQPLQRAAELKPDYWPPYVVLSDYYNSVGDVKAARDILQRALVHSPNSAVVKKRLAALDSASREKSTR